MEAPNVLESNPKVKGSVPVKWLEATSWVLFFVTLKGNQTENRVPQRTHPYGCTVFVHLVEGKSWQRFETTPFASSLAGP